MSTQLRVLVTGGAGFIGSHVVDRLVGRGQEVTILDNLDPQVHGENAAIPADLTERTHFIRGDIREASVVERALANADAVIHLAAAVGVGQSMYVPHYYTSVNVDGQGVLLEEMAKNPSRWRRFVVASSMSIYGEGAYACPAHGTVAPLPRSAHDLAAGQWEVRCPVCGRIASPVLTAEDKPLQHTSIYAITKKTQEELGLCFGAAYDIPTLALRFFNVYGSRQALSNPYTGAAAIFMSRLKNGNPPLVFEDGRQTRDFIHVSDIADGVVRALDADATVSGALNLCTGRPVMIREVAESLAARLDVPILPEVVSRYRVGDIRHCVGDPARARDAIGFEARRDFVAGLDELIEWAASQEADDRVEAGLAELNRQHLVR
jgi:dTDP-L-rhamnose 4-epimerase